VNLGGGRWEGSLKMETYFCNKEAMYGLWWVDKSEIVDGL
jgi:hypothetical protein